MGEQQTFRCAVYTRKSSEEGLEQDFNSLEAQREACEAYIRSQSHEGWKLIPDRFDDGGFSGGNMARPALGKLMNMIREEKVDVIVIYKIDRLTRSLTDFARLAETFDKHGVSFVSVTQQFNTTTSMGRLMLNVLLSFAQFEREITGERIRDKIAASKKKGMWMGGPTPMGYDVKDRQLVINDPGAPIVRHIFNGYLEAGDVPTLLDRLTVEKVTTAVRTSAKGKTSGGRPFTRGHLYKLLSNPIYIGRIPHRATSHPGNHQAIIDRATWDRVQAQLASNTQGARNRRRRAVGQSSLLNGLLFANGRRMIPMHATKGARRYRYYVEDDAKEVSNASPVGSSDGVASVAAEKPKLRLPANEIEVAVVAALRHVLGKRYELLEHLDALPSEHTSAILIAAEQLAARFEGRLGVREQNLIRQFLAHVTYSRDHLMLQCNEGALLATLGFPTLVSERPTNSADAERQFTVRAPLIYRRRGVQTKLSIPGASAPTREDASLVAIVAQARVWADKLISGEFQTIPAMASAEGLSMQYVARIIPLAFLSPHIIEQVLAGNQPVNLTANKFAWIEAVPHSWDEQHRQFASP